MAGTLDLLPEGLNPTEVVTIALTITGIANVAFQKSAMARIVRRVGGQTQFPPLGHDKLQTDVGIESASSIASTWPAN